MQSKTCTKCGVTKTTADFYPGKGYADGHYRWCKLCYNTIGKIWRQSNRERQAMNVKRWGKAHLDARRKHRRDSAKRRRPFRSLAQKIEDRIRNKIWRQLKTGKGGRRTFYLLGYSCEELKSHLEKQFSDRMCWRNYGKWHIDHIKPRASFNITSVGCEDFKKCWALSNLQPLWAKDNLQKWRH